MKRILILILLFSLTLTLLLTAPATASAEPSVPYDLANAYIASHSRRDILSGGEAAAAKTLSDRLASRGYAVTTPSDRRTIETADRKSVVYDYSHVVGFKDNGKGKTVLIGCFYGGYEPTDTLGVGDGASVALSVGVTLYVADALAALSLDYDVAIAFWGGVEVTTDLDLTKCGVDVSKLALYVNFDCIAAGRSDYIYADDVPRLQEKYFREIAAEQGASFEAVPTYKRPSAFTTSADGAYSYLHLGLLGANRSFMNEGIPCVNFVGGAWDYDTGLRPYIGKGEIEGSSLDTVAEIDKLNGGREATSSRLLATAKTVIAALSDARLPNVLDAAAEQISGADLHSDLAYYLISFIGAVLIATFFVLLIVRQGKDRRDVGGGSDFSSPKRDRYDDPYEELRSEEEEGHDEAPADDDEEVFRF